MPTIAYADPNGGAAFVFTDGNRRLYVRSLTSYTYYANGSAFWGSNHLPELEEASEAIEAFLQAYDLVDIEYRIAYSEIYTGYHLLPLTDGLPIRNDHFGAVGWLFTFDEHGIASVNASLTELEDQGSFAIISVQEAFETMLAQPPHGMMLGFHSPPPPSGGWERVYPYGETVTLVGWISSMTPIGEGSPVVTLDSHTVVGATQDLVAEMRNTLVEATGHFEEQDGVRVFVLESWHAYDGVFEGHAGTLRAEGDQVVLHTDEGLELIMLDTPAGITLPLEGVYAMGVTRGDIFDWAAFDLRMTTAGGGGGGGGDFYRPNLTGTLQVLPPTPTPWPTLEPSEYEVPESTIELVELVYLTPMAYRVIDGSALYAQPAWRFLGHWSNGDEFEVFVQALHPDFLSPEIQALEGPG